MKTQEKQRQFVTQLIHASFPEENNWTECPFCECWTAHVTASVDGIQANLAPAALDTHTCEHCGAEWVEP